MTKPISQDLRSRVISAVKAAFSAGRRQGGSGLLRPVQCAGFASDGKLDTSKNRLISP
ncbi:hypothetical protein [Altericroceibacterium xinjiangense]|uniref:hypothetical protein n=1 Tax=Altericroceibacterium xinjiangense TaxID=762261 RepID=UPI0013DECB1F|nr:hypothetical protein [Altericroceibacterium xinjiangense]